MKRVFMIALLCFSLFFISASVTVQAEGEGISAEAVICVIPQGMTENSAEVAYFNSLEDAFNAEKNTKLNERCTIKLLKDVSSERWVQIESGDFTFDLNGKTLSADTETGSCINIMGGSVCFKDSSMEKTGTVIGSSSAISISGDANVTVESGNYEADTWAIFTTDTSDYSVTLRITGGCFQGNVGVQTSIGKNYTISGGEFYGNQNAVNNNGTMEITGGTFYGEIYNAGGAVLIFRNGKVVVSEKNSNVRTGIQNCGILNLYGGNISAAEDAMEPIKGVENQKDAILNLYGDVSFQKVETDFWLTGAMNVCSSLNNRYRVAMDIPDDNEGGVFANAASEVSLSKANFISGVTGYVVEEADHKSSLYLSKCEHKKINNEYVCEDCGIQMYACIGDEYFLSLADAFKKVENAEAAEMKTVKALKDISEDKMDYLHISGGTFTFDLNGHTIADTLNVEGGNVTIAGNGGAFGGLSIMENAYAEMKGLTLKGETPVFNSGTFRMTDGKVEGGLMAITNMSGTVYLDGGEILAEKIAVMNLGGNAVIGKEDGTGPSIEAPVGILNAKTGLTGDELDAVLNINGGTITSGTDIYNKTGNYALDENSSELPLEAGTVKLAGGTFVGGITAMLDDGVDLTDILADDYGYYGNGDEKISVSEGALSIDGTVIVKKPTGEEVPEETPVETPAEPGDGGDGEEAPEETPEEPPAEPGDGAAGEEAPEETPEESGDGAAGEEAPEETPEEPPAEPGDGGAGEEAPEETPVEPGDGGAGEEAPEETPVEPGDGGAGEEAPEEPPVEPGDGGAGEEALEETPDGAVNGEVSEEAGDDLAEDKNLGNSADRNEDEVKTGNPVKVAVGIICLLLIGAILSRSRKAIRTGFFGEK